MSGPTVILFFADPFTRNELLDAMVAMGGTPEPNPYVDAAVGEDGAGAWVNYRPESDRDPDYEPKELAYVASRLGGRLGPRVILTGTQGDASELMMLKVIESLARRWSLLIDRNVDDSLTDGLFTAEQLRARLVDGLPLFYDPIPPDSSSV